MEKVTSLAKACKDLMLKEPFYGLFLIALNKKWDTSIPTACVGLRNIHVELLLNPDFWESLNAKEQQGLLKHELLHIAFFHITNTYNHLPHVDILNWAMDIEINQYIDKDILPPDPLLPESFPELNLELKRGTIYYYNKLLEQQQQNEKNVMALMEAAGEGLTKCTLPNGNTVNLPKHDWENIQALDETTQKLVETQITHVLTQVAEQIKSSAGTIPGEMDELIKLLTQKEPPKFDWRGYIRRFAGKSTKIYTKKSRRKYNKRSPDFPGLKIKQQKHILAAIDTSGSVNTNELKEFLHEIYHMFKTGSEVTLIQCDTAISHVGKFNPSEDVMIHGRGGTSFQPVIDYYNENYQKYSCLIYLTDGEASTPENVKGNILWVLSTQSQMNNKLPGSVIQLN